MTYNLSGIASNSTTMLNYVQGVNDILMFGWLGTLFLIGIAVLALLSFFVVTNDVRRSLAATSYLTFALAILMKAMSLIGDLALYISLIAAGVIIATTWKKD